MFCVLGYFILSVSFFDLVQLVESRVATSRIQKFLSLEELPVVPRKFLGYAPTLTITNGNFSWNEKQISPTLVNIQAKVNR